MTFLEFQVYATLKLYFCKVCTHNRHLLHNFASKRVGLLTCFVPTARYLLSSIAGLPTWEKVQSVITDLATIELIFLPVLEEN